MHARSKAAVAAAAILMTTACTTTSSTKAAPPASPTPPAPAASPSPSATRYAFGQSVTTNNAASGTTATATVLGYQQGITAQQSADAEFGTTGYVWAALEIKVCSVKGQIATSRLPWVLAYADGSRIEPSGTTYGDFPKPEYPFEAKLKAGDCVRGKTTYAVPAAQRPARILYTTPVLPEPAEWSVPAS
ncbi:DUF4352 domain-containing protein [Streptomyces sp. NPDC127110]|uniref:DUF4352 domain-containing protein n=1 Tax=Streptomyces sp. NPDC127110 TaxID=3345362 RepID=UPI0036322DA6